MSKVVILGAGQDASYMAEYLLEKTDNEVIVATRRTSHDNLTNLSDVMGHSRLSITTVDLADANSIMGLIRETMPDYLINLAGSTFVPESANSGALVMQVNAIALIHILEAVRQYTPYCRVFSAGSSMQADAKSIYGVSKEAAQGICKVYRQTYGLYVTHGILNTHTSPRQNESFLPAKISKGVARIAKAIKESVAFDPIEVGNLDSVRQWAAAQDVVDGIWRSLNQSFPAGAGILAPNQIVDGLSSEDYNHRLLSRYLSDYTFSSDRPHSVRDLIEKAFGTANIIKIQSDQGPQGNQQVQLRWRGEGASEVYELGGMQTCVSESGWDSSWGYWKTLVKINPAFYRPLDVISAPCDSSAARRELGWEPKMSFNQIIQEMVRADMAALNI